MIIASAVIHALDYDFDGNGDIMGWETAAADLVALAAVLTALFFISKYIRRGFRRIRIWSSSINHLVVATQEFLDDWRGTPSEGGVPATPGVMETIAILKHNQEDIQEKAALTAEIAHNVAEAQITTAAEVTARFDKGSATMAKLSEDVARLERTTKAIAKIVDYELATNGGGSIKDDTNASSINSAQIKKAMVDSGMMHEETGD